MEQVVKNALANRLEKRAGFLEDELDTMGTQVGTVGSMIGVPAWAAYRAANPLGMLHTAGKSLKYGLGGMGIGAGLGGLGGAGLGYYAANKMKLPLAIKLLSAGVGGLGGAAIGGAAGGLIGAPTGAAIHNPWRTYRKKQLKRALARQPLYGPEMAPPPGYFPRNQY